MSERELAWFCFFLNLFVLFFFLFNQNFGQISQRFRVNGLKVISNIKDSDELVPAGGICDRPITLYSLRHLLADRTATVKKREVCIWEAEIITVILHLCLNLDLFRNIFMFETYLWNTIDCKDWFLCLFHTWDRDIKISGVFNHYHSLGRLRRCQICHTFVIILLKLDLSFHANCLLWREFARNVKSCFSLGKCAKIFKNVDC